MQEKENQIIEFTILFNKHKKRIYNYALKMLKDKMRADDIVQDVFIKLFENLNSIHNKQSIKFWLFKTARNEMMTFYRSTKNKKFITASLIQFIVSILGYLAGKFSGNIVQIFLKARLFFDLLNSTILYLNFL